MTNLVVFLIAAAMTGAAAFALNLAVARLKTRQLRQRLANKNTSIPQGPAQEPGRRREEGLLVSLHYFLLSAGLKISAKTFIAVPVILASSLGLTLFIMLGHFIPALCVSALILILPVLYVVWKKKQIQSRIIMEMPDAIGMVVRSLKIGMAVDAALKEAGDALTGPLGMEIKIIYREMAVGIPFANAFQGFIRRYPALPDVRLFSTAFILQRETGGNLALILETLARTIQNRFVFKRQIKTYTAEARLSAIIISLLPLLFALVAWIANPGYIGKLTGTSLGRAMIYTAIGLEVAGFLVMRKMAKVKV